MPAACHLTRVDGDMGTAVGEGQSKESTVKRTMILVAALTLLAVVAPVAGL